MKCGTLTGRFSGKELDVHRVGNRKYIRPKPSARRIKMWAALRQWKKRNRAYHNFGNVYQASTLLGQIAAGCVRPQHLDEFSIEKPVRAQAIAWIALACLVRKAYALTGTRDQWGALLHCHPNTVDSLLSYLVEEGWIKRIADFVPSRSTRRGRKGERLKHFRKANWYAPAWRLDLAWRRFQQRQGSARLAEPINEKEATTTGKIPDQNCDPSSYDSKKQTHRAQAREAESPAGTVDLKPTPSANGAVGPLAVSAAPTESLRRPAGAADQGGRAQPVPGPAANAATRYGQRRGQAPIDDAILALIDKPDIDISTKREWIAEYQRNPEIVGAMLRAWRGPAGGTP